MSSLLRNARAGWIPALLWFLLLPEAAVAGLAERAFFYNDIYHFIGNPRPSPDFGVIRSLRQPFRSNCANLNRIIVPFYQAGADSSGRFVFSLHEAEGRELFSVPVDAARFPPPAKIGTHDIAGVLHPIAFPPLADSRQKAYYWELELADDSARAPGWAVILTQRSNPRLGEALLDGAAGGTYAAFYSYCLFEFDAAEIARETGHRLAGEKYFLTAYAFLLAGVLWRMARRA